MKRRIYTNNGLLILYVLVLLSCAVEKASYSGNTKIYMVNFDTTKMRRDFCYSNLFDSVTLIRLDGDQAIIGRIDKMDLYEDKLIVLDERHAKGVFVFDKGGNLIRKIGGVGFSPEEYTTCTDFTIDNQTGVVYIYDQIGKKICLYDIDSGNYLRTIKLESGSEIQRIWCNSGMLYTINTFFSSWNSDGENYILRQLDINSGHEIGQWMDVDQYNKGWRDLFTFSSLFYHIGDGKDLLAFGLSDTVMCINNGKITPYMAFSGDKVIKPEDISEEDKNGILDSKIRTEMRLRLGHKMDKITGVLDMFKCDDNLYFSYTTWPLYLGICNMNTGEVSTYSNFEDDILYASKFVYRTLPSFLTSDAGGVYYCIGTDYLSDLKDHLKEGFISNKVTNKDVIKIINEDSNPILLYYEYSKKQ
ncbi:6-bladed beta-propeller [Bacteroides sp. UBA939]|uniref:6-bladed beta-propeller n=1 Tax=Bacteroides sp. UBA939 TaxID=1946092 RepID=UPI0025C05C9D|nr:6-bladed beta-propeller [Bacteroides sp. UBA939]